MIGKKLVVAVVVGVMVLLGVFAQKAEAQYTPQSADLLQFIVQDVNVTNNQVLNVTKSAVRLRPIGGALGATNTVTVSTFAMSNVTYTFILDNAGSCSNGLILTNTGTLLGLVNGWSPQTTTNDALSVYANKTNSCIELGRTR